MEADGNGWRRKVNSPIVFLVACGAVLVFVLANIVFLVITTDEDGYGDGPPDV